MAAARRIGRVTVVKAGDVLTGATLGAARLGGEIGGAIGQARGGGELDDKSDEYGWTVAHWGALRVRGHYRRST